MRQGPGTEVARVTGKSHVWYNNLTENNKFSLHRLK